MANKFKIGQRVKYKGEITEVRAVATTFGKEKKSMYNLGEPFNCKVSEEELLGKEEPKKPTKSEEPEQPQVETPKKEEPKSKAPAKVTWKALKEMGTDGLLTLAAKKGIEIDPQDFDSEDEIREAIAEELCVKKGK